MSDLKNNVTSDWIRATGFFGHTPHRISVSLFVEGDDDLNIQKLAASGDFSALKGANSSEGITTMETIGNRLSEMDCAGRNLWKVMRGHNLWNTIVKPDEERLINERIKEITDQQVAEGNPFDRIAAMNQLGIYTRVKDFVEVEFYNNNLDGISIPAETRSKLDSLFS